MAFRPHVPMCDLAKLVLQKGDELIQTLAFSRSPTLQKNGYRVRLILFHGLFGYAGCIKKLTALSAIQLNVQGCAQPIAGCGETRAVSLLHSVLIGRDAVHGEQQNHIQPAPVSAETWARIGELFEAALAESPQQRARFLKEKCPEEPEICREVLSLLEFADTAGSFLHNPGIAWTGRQATFERGYKLAQFEILDVIGRGGMGDVYRARDLRLRRDVAIKVLPPAFAHDPERVARFEREAKAVASLSHPNVVHVYEAGETDGNLWIASELVQGHSLDRVIERGSVPLASCHRDRDANRPGACRGPCRGYHSSRSHAGKYYAHAGRRDQNTGFRYRQA